MHVQMIINSYLHDFNQHEGSSIILFLKGLIFDKVLQ